MSGDPFPNPLGWEVSYKDDGISDPWTASHLDKGVTVFGANIAELGREIADYQSKWQMSRALAKLGFR
jgi:hypothetical protein